jgi:hypothetical protein
MLPQVGFNVYPLPPAIHDPAAGEILVGNPAVLKGDLVSQEPTPNFEGIILFDRVLFCPHLRKIEHSLKQTIPTDLSVGMVCFLSLHQEGLNLRQFSECSFDILNRIRIIF